MHVSKKYNNSSPKLKANFLSKLFFWWLNSLFWHGRKHDLEEKDLYNVLPEDLSEPIADKLEGFWKEEIDDAFKNKRKPKLLNAILKTFGLSYLLFSTHVLFLSLVIRVFQPLTLGLLIRHFDSHSTTTDFQAFLFATGVVGMSFLQAIVGHHSNSGQLRLGMRLRVACSSLIYRKTTRLSCTSANRATGGVLINLLSNDVARFDVLFIFLHYIWVMPLQVAVITYLIWQHVGMATFAGVVLITLQTVPIQAYCGKLTSNLRSKVAIRTDERVMLMSEIIHGIRVIKMYAWEKPFEEAVSLARKHEIDVLALKSYLKGINLASFVFTERTTLYITILAFVLQGNVLTADIAFTLAQYYNILQLTMAIFYPSGVACAAEANVSIKRIEKFLLLDEYEPLVSPLTNAEDLSIIVKGASASWVENTIARTLHDINVVVPKKKIVCCRRPCWIWEGELEAATGQIFTYGKISYASQEPWLFNGSIRNNILFGLPYDEKKYKKVTKVCALTLDFQQLPHGDKTLVGERGSALSGGQCARVNLARAVYRDADIYLLDDPLSAVDTHVGKHLFDDCIDGYLKNKTRILVTHQVHYLKGADVILLINNGRLEFQGSFANFEKDSQRFKNLAAGDTVSEKNNSDAVSLDLSSNESLQSFMSVTSNLDEEEPQETAELMAKGNVAKSMYWKYFRAGASYLMIILVIKCFIFAQLLNSGCDFWVKYWTKEEQRHMESNFKMNQNFSQHLSSNDINETDINSTTIIPFLDESNETTTTDLPDLLFSLSNTLDYSVTEVAKEVNFTSIGQEEIPSFLDPNTAIYVYTFLIIGSVVISTLRNVLFYKICMTASKNLHDNMFACLLRTPMRFFDMNPSGRILNRFSKDTGAVDETLPMAMLEAFQIFSVMIGIMAQVFIINWWTVFPMIIMGVLYWQLRNIYLATVQDIKRLEGNAKSPVFSYANASLNGLLTIRSSQAEEMVCKEFDELQDAHTSAHYLIVATSASFGFWLDIVSIAFVSFVTYSFIIVNKSETLAGDVGLAVSQVLILCGMLQYGMRQTAEMVAQMTSVERIIQFTQLDQEGPFDSQSGNKPSSKWPNKGRIIFDHVYLKYSEEDEPVLKNLNFIVEPGMKVGIVGRTGAGKSSLVSALFRLANVDGSLIIDNVDVSKIGLKDLRSKISIIPQEPILFTSTMRKNIDPFKEFQDVELWEAINTVELSKAFLSLDHAIERGGSNLSAGQRQLLCLARAIIKKNKILIMDEATANVDPNTDALIQKTIRTQFQECTVLTIAHRLDTVMDSDKVLVMDNGVAVEYDHPYVLLQQNDGIFTGMVKQTGNNMSGNLRKIAEESYSDTERTNKFSKETPL